MAGATRARDAIEMLKADHRLVCRLLHRFECTESMECRVELAETICEALTIHMIIEEEIFYPAFLAATMDEEMFLEAKVEHEGVRRLIKQIEESGPRDECFAARIRVLSAMTRHHIQEEEKRGGLFAEAVCACMDVASLGLQMKARKARLKKRMVLLRGRIGPYTASA